MTPSLPSLARMLGTAMADAFWNEFGVRPADEGPEGVGDWDATAWGEDMRELERQGATPDDLDACHEAWLEGFWSEGSHS